MQAIGLLSLWYKEAQHDHLINHTLGATLIAYGSYYDYYSHTHIFNLNCTGMEDGILDCPYIERGSYTCSPYSDAAVICQCKKIT